MPLFGDDPLPTLLQSSVLRRRIAETADLPPSRQPSIPSCAPPPAGRPSAGQPSAEPKTFGSGKNNNTVLYDCNIVEYKVYYMVQ